MLKGVLIKISSELQNLHLLKYFRLNSVYKDKYIVNFSHMGTGKRFDCYRII